MSTSSVKTQKSRVIAKLTRMGKTGRFFRVVNNEDGSVGAIDPDSTPQAPESANANEIESEFGQDREQGRRVARRRISWRFQLILAFSTEVNCEFFESDALDPVTILEADHENGFPAVRLELVSAEYNHPPKRDASNGSRITYTFEAVEGRR